MPGVFMIGYDVEHSDAAVTSAFLGEMRRLHESAGVPATLFVVGRIAGRHADELAAIAAHPLFDVQQHTYSHMLMKTVCQENDLGTRVFPGGSPEEVAADVARGQEALRKACAVRCTGLTGPYNYYRGLSDRPDLLRACWEAGIRFLRTDGRDANDWQPVPLDRQPYWYAPQGFPAMLECCIHGWQDCILRERLGWDRTEAYAAEVAPWLAAAARHDQVFSYCQHDWSSIRQDPHMSATGAILREVRALGMRPLLYADYYRERRASA